jgi:nitric oxide reductase NorD protein
MQSYSHFYRALSGRPAEFVFYDDSEVWPHPDTATTIRLLSRPPVPDFYLVALTHRSLHHLLGTFADPSFLELFIRRFDRTALAIEVFTVLEDLRIDAYALRRFAGLRPSFLAVQRDALSSRPSLAQLPPRSAVAEALLQFSLGAPVSLPPAVLRAAQDLTDPAATVSWTAEATFQVYDELARLPNVGASGFPSSSRPEADEVPEVRLAPVHYRDAPGPRYAGLTSSGMPLSEAILRLTSLPASEPDFVDKSLSAERGGIDVTAPPDPLPHDHGPDLDGHDELPSGHLHRHGRDTYLYPEWDAIAGRYLPDWCLLRVGRPRLVQRPRRPARYRHLLPELVRQLERVRPAGRDFVARMPSGDDLDLDACVEAMVDLRTGVQPSERVFVDVVERRRDVAVAFALDLSSSTAERLSGPTRIIDLQRDAVGLLVEALERVGDAYGIYGFSGGGRDDVRLSVVKDLEERRSPAMQHRLAGLTPDHTTRMGPPIRHLTSVLERTEASTKILLIISDGRPFDLDYGQQYGDEAVLTYAVADTARALDEARARGVRPYLITVDPAGGDYLSQMCDPQEYHVISDAKDLPAALAQLYLVARSRPAGPGSVPRRPAR